MAELETSGGEKLNGPMELPNHLKHLEPRLLQIVRSSARDIFIEYLDHEYRKLRTAVINASVEPHTHPRGILTNVTKLPLGSSMTINSDAREWAMKCRRIPNGQY